MVAQEQQKPFVIGLDLGGTNSVFGIVDQRGNILTTNSIKTQAYKTAEDFVSAGVESRSKPWASVRPTATTIAAR